MLALSFMGSLQRVLSPGGRLYFSVPVGRERVEFLMLIECSRQRRFSDAFPALELVSFSFVGDDGCLYEDRDPIGIPDSDWACGLFEFTKQSVLIAFYAFCLSAYTDQFSFCRSCIQKRVTLKKRVQTTLLPHFECDNEDAIANASTLDKMQALRSNFLAARAMPILTRATS